MIAYEVSHRTDNQVSALVARVSAGMPLEISDEIVPVDLNVLLSKGSKSSLLISVEGDSMQDVPIVSGDWVMVDCARGPVPNDIVIARLNGGYTIKRHKLNDARGRRGLYLVAGNRKYDTRQITEVDEYHILGVVTHIIHPTT